MKNDNIAVNKFEIITENIIIFCFIVQTSCIYYHMLSNKLQKLLLPNPSGYATILEEIRQHFQKL